MITELGPLPEGWSETRPDDYAEFKHPLVVESIPTLKELIFKNLPENNIVYHYCSNSAFKSIVEMQNFGQQRPS